MNQLLASIVTAASDRYRLPEPPVYSVHLSPYCVIGLLAGPVRLFWAWESLTNTLASPPKVLCMVEGLTCTLTGLPMSFGWREGSPRFQATH